MRKRRIVGREAFAAFLALHGLTKSRAAEALGVSQPCVSQWVSGARVPSLENRESIAVWTRGAVPVPSWGTHRRSVVSVQPFEAA